MFDGLIVVISLLDTGMELMSFRESSGTSIFRTFRLVRHDSACIPYTANLSRSGAAIRNLFSDDLPVCGGAIVFSVRVIVWFV